MMKRRAFTLVELLVVIAIIGLLSTVAVVALEQSRVNARNAKRKGDLIQISKALELYYADHDAYPTTSGSFFGTCSNAGSKGVNDWIPGLVSEGYMAQLPQDPTNRLSPSVPVPPCEAAWACYVYRSNGTDFKLLSLCVVEGANSFPSNGSFFDPIRPTWSWAVYSPGGRNF
jgi:prepilin-type N-terminal cleavage/methylation domain-containing protein